MQINIFYLTIQVIYLIMLIDSIIKTNFLFNQTIIEIDTHIKLIE